MKILLMSDVHFDRTPGNPHYPASLVGFKNAWQFLVRNKHKYSKLILTGDITSKGAADIEELHELKKLLDGLVLDYLPIPGNHDLCPLEGMENRYPGIEEYEYKDISQTNHATVFGPRGIRAVEMVNGILCISFAIRNKDPDGQIPWLVEQLQLPAPKLVFGHYPLYPTRDAGYCNTWDYFRIEDSIEPLKDIIFKEENRVLAYFCGHQHINSRVRVQKTFQVETASTVLGSCSYRILDFRKKAIRISTHQIPGTKNWPGEVSLPDQSIDSTHPVPLSYHQGNADERDFDIFFD